MNNDKSIAAVILAGGESKRMNDPKPFLIFENRTRFIDRIIEKYQSYGIEKIIVVLNKKFESLLKPNKKIKIVYNENPELGRFYSIRLGLHQIGESKYCFIQNIDNPFITEDILEIIEKNKELADCIIPTCMERGGHPVLIGNKIIRNILRTKTNDIVLKDYLHKYKIKKIETENDTILININTHEDYKKYFLMTF